MVPRILEVNRLWSRLCGGIDIVDAAVRIRLDPQVVPAGVGRFQVAGRNHALQWKVGCRDFIRDIERKRFRVAFVDSRRHSCGFEREFFAGDTRHDPRERSGRYSDFGPFETLVDDFHVGIYLARSPVDGEVVQDAVGIGKHLRIAQVAVRDHIAFFVLYVQLEPLCRYTGSRVGQDVDDWVYRQAVRSVRNFRRLLDNLRIEVVDRRRV